MLNIAKHIYSGHKQSSSYVLPEAELVPHGGSSNEKKKLASFSTKWTTVHKHENVPLPGFTLAKQTRISWNSAEPTWQVIDPRGFIARITSENLEKILHTTGITEGLIQQRCVWAREDTQTRMILVPISAEAYETAVGNTALIDNKVSRKDLQVGDTVLLQNSLIGRYMGTLSAYGRLESKIVNKSVWKASCSLRKQIVEIEPGRYFMQTDAKILKVIAPSTGLTKEQASSIINAEISNNNALFFPHGYVPDANSALYRIKNQCGEVKLVSPSAVPKPVLTFTEITQQEACVLWSRASSEKDALFVLETQSGEYYIPDIPSWPSPTSMHSFKVVKLTNFKPTESITEIECVPVLTRYSRDRHDHNLKDFAKYYIINKQVKNENYI